jgi:protein-tyrosine-phosphatase
MTGLFPSKSTSPWSSASREAAPVRRGSPHVLAKTAGARRSPAGGLRPSMPSVLLVCSANRCRSPLAEVMLRQALSAAGEQPWRVESAGTWALPGQPATEYSLQEAQRRGLDLSQHRSQATSCALLAQFDLVLTMEREQQAELQSACPAQASRVRLMSEVVGAEYDIEDPYGGPASGYRTLGERLAGLLDEGLPRLRQWAQEAADRRTD